MSLYRKRLRLVKGEGIYVWDSQGKKYIDLIAGIGVNVLGHNHPEWVSELQEQLEKLVVAGPMFDHEEKYEMLEELEKFVTYEYVYIGNSGTEAVEAALKFARLYTGRKEIIAMTNAFHGRTMGALSATWKPKYREDFKPLVPGFKHIPFNDVEAAKEAITTETAAVIFEPIQGEGGVVPANEEFVKTLRDLTEDKGALLIADEVQSGLRTGKFLAIEHYKVEPDIVTMGKGIGNGVPVSLTLTNFDVERGKHGSTFGGNPLACKAVAVTLRILRREKLIEKAAEKFIEIKGENVVLTRGKGLMIGIVMKKPVAKVVEELQNRGYLVHTAGQRVIRLLPPLIISKDEINQAKSAIEGVINDIYGRKN
ncbi:acetylornithine/acetyl-lysine aminotransferase [Pyrococcus furiosus DSM 3638]|uniref:Putative [LysW]-aminoadipate semialdehyde/glutamate semialdehyde transaminase n=3 Tax=Pyrococcus furiosus TaxID=2261 RepID=LYSJ_PYRFU|nr:MULTISPECIES: acetylornithine/succinylornithine family transaminase [Pyrococcus]Q8U0B4.1 RecName: Full=Putative [LysW]-aminoadipate semialdehyde/glutamate semialdehyde transaminase [Pyrococcus furiosus DSM 3638]AAL81809.1 acetylornithine aminotransferase [Pyrococcus furiosus DSM 3638]MDK2870179.1 LysW-gamma-L-lysine/LysW-L-ornithine aminotransferase [Pyrococcus sp.]QEK79721.1 acetylornithine/acetyl-lysine aminotransferase [Pyrococcus furiosus DSM 3638]